jgi:hypothetical protein
VRVENAYSVTLGFEALYGPRLNSPCPDCRFRDEGRGRSFSPWCLRCVIDAPWHYYHDAKVRPGFPVAA